MIQKLIMNKKKYNYITIGLIGHIKVLILLVGLVIIVVVVHVGIHLQVILELLVGVVEIVNV